MRSVTLKPFDIARTQGGAIYPAPDSSVKHPAREPSRKDWYVSPRDEFATADCATLSAGMDRQVWPLSGTPVASDPSDA